MIRERSDVCARSGCWPDRAVVATTVALLSALVVPPAGAAAQAPEDEDPPASPSTAGLLPAEGSLVPGPGVERLERLPFLAPAAEPSATEAGFRAALHAALSVTSDPAVDALYGVPLQPGTGPLRFGSGSVDADWVSGGARPLDGETMDILGVRLLSPYDRAPAASHDDRDGSDDGG